MKIRLATCRSPILLALLTLSSLSAGAKTVQPISRARHFRYAMGLVPAASAQYQKVPAVPAFRAIMPPAWDLSARFPKPGNQGIQPSCVAWAVGYAARSYYVLRSSQTRELSDIVSPAFIYDELLHQYDSKARRPDDCDQGTSILDALKLLESKGSVPLSVLPYDARVCDRLPSPSELDRDGDRFKIIRYFRVSGSRSSWDKIKGELVAGNPVIFGLDVPPGFTRYGPHSGVIRNGTDRGLAYAHAMVIVGYDDSKRAWHFINSWGTGWGIQGFGWISYRAAASLWKVGYVMVVAQAHNSPPQSPPVPSPSTRNTNTPANIPVPGTPAGALRDIFERRTKSWKIRVSPSSTKVNIGSPEINFSITSTKAGFVYILYAGTQRSSLYLLFPNVLDSENYIKSRRPFVIPTGNWTVTALGPPGVDQILVLVTESPRDFSRFALPSQYVSTTGQFLRFHPTAPSLQRLQSLVRTSAFSHTRVCNSLGKKTRDIGIERRCSNAYGAARVRVQEVIRSSE